MVSYGWFPVHDSHRGEFYCKRVLRGCGGGTEERGPRFRLREEALVAAALANGRNTEEGVREWCAEYGAFEPAVLDAVLDRIDDHVEWLRDCGWEVEFDRPAPAPR